MSAKAENANITAIEDEALQGCVPVLTKEKTYKFSDAFFFLASYGIATWNYTQGAYIASLVGFKQVLVTTIFGSLLVMLIFQLPTILSTRYGIDIWVWLKAVLGHNGVKVVTIIVVLVNLPWHAICCELFASSMENLMGLAGIEQNSQFIHVLLSLLCVALGVWIAYRGIKSISLVTKILTPVLLAVGVIVIIVGFSSAPISEIVNYVPDAVKSGEADAHTFYVLAVDAMMAFTFTWFAGMGGIPRLTKTEKSGYWGAVVGQGLVGPFFVIVGAVMAISMNYVTGEMVTDPTLMLSKLAFPAMGLCSLLLVGFANVGTNASVSYVYAVMVKTSFHRVGYRTMVVILNLYIAILCIWGQIMDYLGTLLTLGACMQAPLAAMFCADFFIVRKQKMSLRAGFEIAGNRTYRYTFGFNIIGVICFLAGIGINLLIYNPFSGEVNIPFLFNFTPTMCSFVGTGVLYLALNSIPAIRKYTMKDRAEITV